MNQRNCSEGTNPNKICCDFCNAGEYKKKDCEGTKKTECAKCEPGFFTATENYLKNCHRCKTCSSSIRQIPVINCTNTQNTVCGCEKGFYCNNDECDHCLTSTPCALGEGVETAATRTKNPICVPCKNGTFSNVTDLVSPCKPHIRCDDYGRELKIPGTDKKDAVCGDFKSPCPWLLPAGLWSGFVLTIIIVLVFMVWRKKCKSNRQAQTSIPVAQMDMVPTPPLTPPELPSHCQESCTINECKLPLFNTDDTQVTCSIQDSMDTSLPITPLKASVSFAESSHINGNAGYCSNLFRSYSEPQEDEYCGT